MTLESKIFCIIKNGHISLLHAEQKSFTRNVESETNKPIKTDYIKGEMQKRKMEYF